MFTSGRSYEGMNYQIEVICKINMLIVVWWWGGDMRDGHKNHGHTGRCWGDNDVRDDHQIVQRKSACCH